MNDQPKPASGITKEWLLERAHLEEGLEIGAGRPDNPASGEWTAAYVQHGLDLGGPALIANDHNAALAAEQNKRADWNVVIEDLERDVAKWKEAAGIECGRKEAWFKENQQLREQLAAARQDHTERMNSVQDFYSRQLAAANQQISALQKQLHDQVSPIGQLATAVELAKIGGPK